MADLILEPFAAVQRWRLPAPPDRWEGLFTDYLQTLAQRCRASGPCVIGHIKALVLFPQGRFLRLSVTAERLPATLEGAAPTGCTELELTLNVIVYGLERALLEKITWETAKEVAEKWQAEIS